MDKELLTKVAEFTEVAVSDIKHLKQELKVKEAAEIDSKLQYGKAIDKVANALYSSDFLTDETEKSDFIKKAKENPIYLAQMIEKVCNAADVSLIGKPARVAAQKNEYDPVMARAFGFSGTSVFE